MKRTIRALAFILLIVLASFTMVSCGSKTKEVVGTYYLYNVKVDGETEDAAEYIAEEKENGNTLIIILRKDGTGSMIDHNLMSYGEETMDFSWKMGKKNTIEIINTSDRSSIEAGAIITYKSGVIDLSMESGGGTGHFIFLKSSDSTDYVS